jgi:hypothetical protein
MAQMKFHVEIAVFDPIGSVYTTRYLHQACSEHGLSTQASFKTLDDLFESNKATRCRGRVVDSEATHMLWRIGLFQINECGIQCSKLLHRLLTCLMIVRTRPAFWISRMRSCATANSIGSIFLPRPY